MSANGVPPRALEEATRERQIEYLKQRDIVGEFDLALERLFSSMPEHPVAWLAEYFAVRAEKLGQPCALAPVANGLPCAQDDIADDSLYMRIGGRTQLAAAVQNLLKNMRTDPKVGEFFSHVTDTTALEKKYVDYLSQATGGPQNYTGRPLKEALAACVRSKGLCAEHFDLFDEMLGMALLNKNVSGDDVDDVLASLEQTRAEVLAAVPQSAPAERPTVDRRKSKFAEMGAEPAMDAAVELFQQKLLADDLLGSFFAGVDTIAHGASLKAFLTGEMGGPNKYCGGNMTSVHEGMSKITNEHYDRFVKLFQASLEEVDSASQTMNDVTDILERQRKLIVHASSAASNEAEPETPLVATEPLYERLGGAAALGAVVDLFYSKVLADSSVAPFFQGVDMAVQREKQKAFLTFALGGPNNYTGKSLRQGHEHLVKKGLNQKHFDTVVSLLCKSLQELGAEEYDLAKVAMTCEGVKTDVLGFDDPEADPSSSLFQKFGADAKVREVTDHLFDRVLADPRLNFFFGGVDMQRMRTMFAAFVTVSFGGPNMYIGRSLREAHARLVSENGVNGTHFDIFTNHFYLAIREVGVPRSLSSEAMQRLEKLREEILPDSAVATLYTRIGGAPAVAAAVDLFYSKVMADTRVARFFAGIDMTQQKGKQRSFLTFIVGGPATYTNRSMREAHRPLVRDQGLNATHFVVILEHLGAALRELGVPDKEISEAARIADGYRDEVLCTGEGLDQPLFDRIGGEAAVSKAVALFYTKVGADATLAPHFTGVIMKHQQQQMTAFLSFAFGGPNNYTGKNMRDAHRRLVRDGGLRDSHFDAAAGYLGETLKELGLTEVDIEEALGIVNSVRDEILCRGEGFVSKPLYDRVGGSAAVDAAVDLFYKKVLADDSVNHFFATTDMEAQRKKQKAFLTFVFGGPANYTGKNMRDGHRHFVKKGLNDAHFDAVVAHIGATLVELGVPDDIVSEALSVANSTRDDVLCKGEDLTPENPNKPESLFEQIGGALAVDAAVDLFYKKVLADPRIKHFFATTDMDAQRQKQKAFLTFVFGGPANYTGKSMRNGHRHLVKKGLNDSHFDAVVELLGATLAELNIPADIISQVATIAGSVRDDVLCKGETPDSLYDQIGGASAVDAAVDLFYEKVLADSRIKHFFATTDMTAQRQKQKAFLTFVFGGPANYTGKNMRDGHRHLVKKGLNDSHFDAVVELLGATLAELNIPADIISQVATTAGSVRDDVLCKGEVIVPDSLYDQIGGSAAVDAAVDLFYSKVLADSRVKHFFVTTDMAAQRQKQKAFLTFAFGGPANYTGKNMRDGHRHLVKKGLNDSHFDAIVELLGATLTELKVPAANISQVAAIADSVRDDVLCKGEDIVPDSLYDQIGGSAAVDAAVDLFYSKVLADSRVKHFFVTTDMAAQRQKQKAFLTFAFGGPANYTGKNMRDGHRHLVKKGLNDSHFDAIVELLGATLTELKVPAANISQVAAIADSVRDDVLCKGEGLTLFDRLGGDAAVTKAVDAFYKTVTSDTTLAPFFEGTDMTRLKGKQKQFLTFAFGGPVTYDGKSLRDAHRRLVMEKGLAEVHFDTVVAHLGATLKNLGIDAELVGEAAAIANGVKGDVLCQGEKVPPKSDMLNKSALAASSVNDVRSMLSGMSKTENECEIFETLGVEKVTSIVEVLFKSVAADAELGPFFKNANLDTLQEKFVEYLSSVWGEEMYLGKNLRAAHKNVVADGAMDDHFDLFLAHLKDSMTKHGCSSEVVAEGLMTVHQSARDDVLCKPE